MTPLRTDYQVINGLGTVLYTSNLPEIAKRWARDNVDTYGALEVQEVQTFEQRRRIRRMRPAPALQQEGCAA